MRNVNFESLEFKILSGKHKFNFLNGISDMKGYGPPTHVYSFVNVLNFSHLSNCHKLHE